MSKQSDFKKCCKGLSEEQIEEKVREKAMKDELAYWRYVGLKKYKEMKELGNFSPSSDV